MQDKIMEKPTVGNDVPKRGNRFTNFLFLKFLTITGWHFTGDIPNFSKMVIIGAPHTTNWDFFYTLATQYALGIQLNWMGKHTIFKPPFSFIMRWLGGIPINRSSPGRVIADIVNQFQTRSKFLLAISPEGTRRKVKNWKTGFYRIAKGAGVPILPISLDYKKKEIKLWPIFFPTGNMDNDISTIRSLYIGITGKNSKNF